MPDARLIYADTESSADQRYATSVFIPDPFVWAQVKRGSTLKNYMILSPLEVARIKAERPDFEIFSFGEAEKLFHLKDLSPASQIAGLSRFLKVDSWQVPYDFPAGLAFALKKRKINVKPIETHFFPERWQKSDVEVTHVKEGVALAEAGLNEALSVLKASEIKGNALLFEGKKLTAERLRGYIDAKIASLGGIAANTIVAPGIEGADPHNTGSGPIYPHQPIIIDIFPRVTATGYHGDLTRTVVKGQASDEVKLAHKTIKKARDLAKSMAKPGVKGKTIHAAVHKVIRDAGFKTDKESDPPVGFFHTTGHGLGLEVHEWPRISEADITFKKGFVLTVEPGVYYPEWGGMRLEDVIAIEKGGCRCLTSAKDTLEIP